MPIKIVRAGENSYVTAEDIERGHLAQLLGTLKGILGYFVELIIGLCFEHWSHAKNIPEVDELQVFFLYFLANHIWLLESLNWLLKLLHLFVGYC